MSTQIIAVSTAKQKLLELVRRVDEDGKRYLLVRDGVPVSVLVPVEEYEAWEETLAILEDERTMKSLRRGVRDAAAGKVYVRTAQGEFRKAPRKRRPKGATENAKRLPRQTGGRKGRLRISDDFDAPLPDELLDAFEGRKGRR